MRQHVPLHHQARADLGGRGELGEVRHALGNHSHVRVEGRGVLHYVRSRSLSCLVLVGLAQSQAPTFRSGVEIIRTDIAVIDNRTGKPVTGLTQKDFTVKENGVPQLIAAFLRTVEQQLTRMDEGSRFGYVIGYASASSLRDGRRREVSIDVNRKDVTLVYRRAFTPRTEALPIDPRALITRERLEDAAATAADFDDIRIEGSATQVIQGRDSRVDFQLTIDLNKLTSSTDPKRTITLDIMVLCGDATGQTIGSRVEQLEIDMSDLAGSKFPADHALAVPIKGRPTRAKVVVYSYDDDRLGALSLRVR